MTRPCTSREQCEPGLRLVAPVVGLPEGLLGQRELAPQPVQLAALVDRQPQGWLGRLGQPLAGAPGLGQRVGPQPVRGHDLRAVHQALPAEGHQIGLGLAPVAQRAGPLPGPAQVIELVAGADHRAIGHAGDQRRHLSGGHRGHRLVQQHQPLGRATHGYQRLPLAHPAQGHQVAVTVAITDRRGLDEARAAPRPGPRRTPPPPRTAASAARAPRRPCRCLEQALTCEPPTTRGEPARRVHQLNASQNTVRAAHVLAWLLQQRCLSPRLGALSSRPHAR